MPEQSDFPDSWSKDCDNKGVKVEVLVADDTGATNWIEIPTTNVEVYEEKDRISDIYTLGKVEFPAMWDSVSVSNLIQGFNEGDSISYVRIWFKHSASDEWVLKHFGFASGVGSSSVGVMKMWVYDFADFVRGIPAGFLFDNVQVQDVVRVVTRRINEATPGILVRSSILFNYDRTYGLRESFDHTMTFIHDILADGLDVDEITALPGGTVDWVTVNDAASGGEIVTVAKTFKENRHTIEDVLEWLCERTDARWWFEPTPNGAMLVIDEEKERRLFAQQSVMDRYTNERLERAGGAISLDAIQASTPNWYDRITVIANTALYDINPINTVIVRGDVGNSLSEAVFEAGEDAVTGETPILPIIGTGAGAYGLVNDVFNPSRSFPYVKARVEPLYQRALSATDNTKTAELIADIIDTEDQTIDEAKKTAREALIELLSEQAEGNIVIYGNPKLCVFDGIEVYPTCNRIVDDTSQVPLRFEVESVKHQKQAGDVYKTEVYVSVYVEDDDIVFVEERMAQANEETVTNE